MRSILIAAAVAMLVSLFITPAVIRLFRRRGYGQIIQDELPASQHIKHGTPTMGGTVIIVAFVVGYAAPHLILWRPPTTSGWNAVSWSSIRTLRGTVPGGPYTATRVLKSPGATPYCPPPVTTYGREAASAGAFERSVTSVR